MLTITHQENKIRFEEHGDEQDSPIGFKKSTLEWAARKYGKTISPAHSKTAFILIETQTKNRRIEIFHGFCKFKTAMIYNLFFYFLLLFVDMHRV